MCRFLIVCLLFLLLTFGHPDISGGIVCALTGSTPPHHAYVYVPVPSPIWMCIGPLSLLFACRGWWDLLENLWVENPIVLYTTASLSTVFSILQAYSFLHKNVTKLWQTIKMKEKCKVPPFHVLLKNHTPRKHEKIL
jgi:hypothetical protein